MTSTAVPGARLTAEERREQILLCAIRLFEERPHTEVSTAEIAEAAGVARPLVHHYFGTRQQLYLEVLRRLYLLAPIEPSEVLGTTLPERASHLLDRWLTGVAGRPNTWLAFTAGGGPGVDPDVAAILDESDHLVANRLVDALGLTVDPTDPAARDLLVARVVAWSGMAKAAVRLWLADGQLTEEEVKDLLVRSLLVVLDPR